MWVRNEVVVGVGWSVTKGKGETQNMLFVGACGIRSLF